MMKDYSKNTIQDLRKKSSYDDFNLKYLSMASIIVVILVLIVVIASILIVAGAPNSNFPTGY